MKAETTRKRESIAAKVLRRLRIEYRLALVKRRRAQQVRKVFTREEPSNLPCPVCGATDTRLVHFDRAEGRIDKSVCRKCEHLFSDLLQTDPALGAEMFSFGTQNDAFGTQVDLLVELAEMSGISSGIFLDFGVGGNIRAYEEATRRAPAHVFMGCDTYESAEEGYFATYSPSAPLGRFDGIASYAVVEHLTETLTSWRFFNSLLKPMRTGGGIMLHSFPSQLHHDFTHWAIQIRSHACLFSDRSLKEVCRLTGFALIKGRLPRPVGPHDHPVLAFRKVRDL